VPTSIEVMAQTEGARETEVRARVGGILVKRLYQEGETVKAGQPLFQIDRSTYEIALAEAKAKADQASREMNRLKGLIEAKAISQKDYDDAVSNNAIAQAALRQAQLNLSWTTVTAPVAGTTGRAAKSEGNLISRRRQPAHLDLPEQPDLGALQSRRKRSGQARRRPRYREGYHRRRADLANGTVYPKTGKLNFLASNIDTTLGTQQCAPNSTTRTNQLLPGQFVRIRLLTGERDGVFLVPQAAVLQTEQGHDGHARRRRRTRSRRARSGRRMAWQGLGRHSAALKAGDKVIVDNLMKLRPGAPVAPHAAGRSRCRACGQAGSEGVRMAMSKFFINRPIFASVISIIIVIAGLVASQVLPIAQYPQIAPPTVLITATYPGASAETLAKTVAAPIEEQLNGVENLLYFTSSASANGVLTITATFDVGTNVDMAFGQRQ
jgi:membrane fusion protein (multidrug efflux system)